MEEAVLVAQLRDKATKAKVIRRQKMIPAVFYGHGVESMSLQMDYQTFRRLFRSAGENTIINIQVEGKGDFKALVQSVDFDPVSDEFQHVDFINVRMDEEVTTKVPVVLEGLAPAVKELAGTLVQNLDEIEIRCLPGDLIHQVVLSVESLVDFHVSLHVSDIVVSDKHTIVTDLNLTIASVQAPREEDLSVPIEMPDAPAAVDGKEEEAAE
jgi:large subunit ribosomal protein L25